jgi:hypothetical protein
MGSTNHEIKVSADPMIGAMSPPHKPITDPRIFQGETLFGRLYVVAIKQINSTPVVIKKV